MLLVKLLFPHFKELCFLSLDTQPSPYIHVIKTSFSCKFLVLNRSFHSAHNNSLKDQITLYEDTAKALKSKPIYIELGPTTALAKTGVLKWVLKSISLKPITAHEPKNKVLLLRNLSNKKSLSIRCE